MPRCWQQPTLFLLQFQAFNKFNFSKSDFALIFLFTQCSLKTNSGSLVIKLPHTLLIVNPPIYYCILSQRSPGPHGKIVLGPKFSPKCSQWISNLQSSQFQCNTLNLSTSFHHSQQVLSFADFSEERSGYSILFM